MERSQEARQGVGRVGGATDRAVVQRLAGNPRHHGPVLGNRSDGSPNRTGVGTGSGRREASTGCRRRSYRGRHRERQARGQHGLPPTLLKLKRRGGVHPLHAHCQLIPEAPHLVAPAALHLTDGQPPYEVWMLLQQQGANHVRGDLKIGVVHATSRS